MLLAVVFASLLTAAPASCSEFVGANLAGGWASGSTVQVLVQRQTAFVREESNAVLTLDYAPYPRVAGTLIGEGLSIGVEDGAVRLELTDANVKPSGCLGSTVMFGTTDDALVTLVLKR